MKTIEQLLETKPRVHFIGIGGAGMCPLAEILHQRGYEISGSDNNESETLARVRALGIPVTLGQRAENIQGAGMIVYTAALLPDNPELVAAKASGIPTFERSKLLGALTRGYGHCICVSGTHGKTTVTAMITQILLEAGLDPSAVIGGKLPTTGTNGIAGGSGCMVVEACEFVDTFLELSPGTAVILNIDEDHMDYFKTMENLIASFHKFAALASKNILVNGDDENTKKALTGLEDRQIITFGLSAGNDYSAADIRLQNQRPAFTLVCRGEALGRVALRVPGEHNISNALAAIAAARNAGADTEACIRALEQFGGAGRRFEMLAEIGGITIADDYAHHPRELEVTLRAAMGMGYRRVWAVFQPFTYSRTALLFDDFVRVLQIPDKVVLTEIMGSREVNTYQIYTAQLAEKIPGSVWYNSFEEVADHIVEHAQSGDLVITLGCGDVYKAAKLMIQKYTALSEH